MSLRYLSPWDPGTLEPLDLGTLGPWDSSYLFLLLFSLGMVWLWCEGGGELWYWRMRLEMDLYIDLKKLDLLLPSTFSSSNLLPPPSYSSQLLHPPPKPPPNSSYLFLKALRWLIRSYMKIFQCYSVQKSFMVVVVVVALSICLSVCMSVHLWH